MSSLAYLTQRTSQFCLKVNCVSGLSSVQRKGLVTKISNNTKEKIVGRQRLTISRQLKINTLSELQIQKQAPQQESEIWQRLTQLKKSGAVFQGVVQDVTSVGAFVDVYGLKGLIPLKEMIDQSKENLVGKQINVRLVEIDQSRSRIILSEKEAQLKFFCDQLKVGDIVSGTVSYIQDYGAFVALKDNQGNQTNCQALIHISQLSWDRVSLPDQIVQIGQEVVAKVISVEPSNLRIGLSLRELDQDPLMMSIDSSLSTAQFSEQEIEWEEVSDQILSPALRDIITALQNEDGIQRVSFAKQATTSKAVSQDLQVFMTRDEMQDGFNLIARAGNLVQYIRILTKLSRNEFKSLLQKVLSEFSMGNYN